MKTLGFFLGGILIGGALAFGVLSSQGTVDFESPFSMDEVTSARADSGGGDGDVLAGEFESPAEVADQDMEGKRRLRYHLARATIEALGGRIASCRTELRASVELEAQSSMLTPVVELLPEEERLPTLTWLIGEFDGVEWNDWEVWGMYERFGEPDIAFDAIAASLSEQDEYSSDHAGALIRIYPERAALLLMRLAEEGGWAAAACVNIAEMLRNSELEDLAIRFLRTAISLSPDYDRAYEVFMEIDPSRMQDLAQSAAQEHPESAKAWRRLAEAKLDGGDQAGAFEAFSRAAELGGNDQDELFRSMIRIDPEAALPAIRQLARPDDEDSLGMFGHALVANGLVDEAYETYLRAHALDPDDVTWLRCLVEIDPGRATVLLRETISSYTGSGQDEIVGARANALMLLGRNADAYEEYSAALSLDDDDWEWMEGIAASDPRRAAPLLEKRLEGSPDSRNIKGALGDAYAALGRDREAAALYRDVLDSSSSEKRWKISLAQVAPEEGLGILKADIRNAPDDGATWGALGDAYRKLGRPDEARKAYRKATAIDPSDWRWHTRLKALP